MCIYTTTLELILSKILENWKIRSVPPPATAKRRPASRKNFLYIFLFCACQIFSSKLFSGPFGPCSIDINVPLIIKFIKLLESRLKFLTYYIKMIKNFLSPKRNRQFVFALKIEYKLVAERSEANQNRLQFPTWCPGSGSNRRPFALQANALAN